MPRRPSRAAFAVELRARVRSLREEAGLTQEGLAHQSECGKGHVSDIEAGRVYPTVKTLRKLANGLGIDAFDLLVTPAADVRQRLIEQTRLLPPDALERLSRRASVMLEEHVYPDVRGWEAPAAGAPEGWRPPVATPTMEPASKEPRPRGGRPKEPTNKKRKK